jgi:CRISPR-associated protein Cas1
MLPKVRDRLSGLYIEHARIDRHEKSIAIHDANGVTPIPVATLCVLMLGPGVNVTQAAITTIADNNCLVVWCGEENVRFYAFGNGGTRSAALLIHQARLASFPDMRLEVVKRLYRMRFNTSLDENLTVEQLRGMEGVRVREAYARASVLTGVMWTGRNYDRSNWSEADTVNRALSCANSCLYGLCHAAILSIGASPGLGFIHVGKQLSFVYDIADLYKLELTIPVAFEIAKDDPPDIERQVRLRCRDRFRDEKLLQRVVPDIQKVLSLSAEGEALAALLDEDPALPTDLWSPDTEEVAS